MFKYTVSYEDFNGDEKSVELYFNLSLPEMLDLENQTPGGYGAKLNNIAALNDTKEAYFAFQELIALSYGEKSSDGNRFLKKDPETGESLFDRFKETPAYEKFIVDLMLEPSLSSAFAEQIVPEKYLKQIASKNEANVSQIQLRDA